MILETIDWFVFSLFISTALITGILTAKKVKILFNTFYQAAIF